MSILSNALRALVFVVPVIAGACSELEGCPADLRITLAPTDTTIAPGEQFQPHVTLLGCGGTKKLTDSLTWTSSDLNVAVVGTYTGIVIGAHAGTAEVAVIGQTYHNLGTVRVTVR